MHPFIQSPSLSIPHPRVEASPTNYTPMLPISTTYEDGGAAAAAANNNITTTDDDGGDDDECEVELLTPSSVKVGDGS